MKYIKMYNENIKWNDFDDFDNFDIEEEDPNIHPDFLGHEKFFEYLKNFNILDEYIKNYDSFFVSRNLDTIKSFLDNTKCVEYINFAFDWSFDNIIQWSYYNSKWISNYC